jgi:hypothetical protein
MVKEVFSRTGRHWIDEELGILRFTYYPNTRQATLADAKENFAAVTALVAGKRYPFLCDLKNCLDVDAEAQEFYASPEFAQNLSAMALLGGGPIGKVMGTVFLAVAERCVPTALFSSEAEAIEWLKTFV